ncbi:cyclophilin-like fold protein [Eleftheria terrae]|uniref:cyclophilin-like fold protein n=1 Tax=Eleftheria terrae TaxID=1597781 RepID=UPI00263AF16B|nr:cyclophilin-like fold protein [Eleftheria terrae]WKB54414.1 cyclophilin-like fold protein [Eleftheria terrae]
MGKCWPPPCSTTRRPAPWGNLAIFYRDFDYSRGLVKLGRTEGDARPLAVRGPVKVRIELVGN